MKRLYFLCLCVLSITFTSCMTMILNEIIEQEYRNASYIDEDYKKKECLRVTEQLMESNNLYYRTNISGLPKITEKTFFYDIEYGMSYEEVLNSLNDKLRNYHYEDLEYYINKLCEQNYHKYVNRNDGYGWVSTSGFENKIKNYTELDARTTHLIGTIDYCGLKNWNIDFSFFDNKLENIVLSRKHKQEDIISLKDILDFISEKNNISYKKYSTPLDTIGSSPTLVMNYYRYHFVDDKEKILFNATQIDSSSLKDLFFDTEYEFEFEKITLERVLVSNAVKERKEKEKRRIMEGLEPEPVEITQKPEKKEKTEEINKVNINNIINNLVFEVSNGGNAQLTNDDNVYHIKVRTGGSENWSIIQYQMIKLEPNSKYVVSLDAKSNMKRQIIMDINTGDPNYARILSDKYLTISPEWEHFEYEFKTGKTVNYRYKFELLYGKNNADVFLRNISLSKID